MRHSKKGTGKGEGNNNTKGEGNNNTKEAKSKDPREAQKETATRAEVTREKRVNDPAGEPSSKIPKTGNEHSSEPKSAVSAELGSLNTIVDNLRHENESLRAAMKSLQHEVSVGKGQISALQGGVQILQAELSRATRQSPSPAVSTDPAGGPKSHSDQKVSAHQKESVATPKDSVVKGRTKEFFRASIQELDPRVNFLSLELVARIVEITGPATRMANGQQRDVFCCYVSDKSGVVSRTNPRGVRTMLLSLWGPTNLPLPENFPREGEVAVFRGFTGAKPTGTFNQWADVELQGNHATMSVEVIADDGTMPVEKALNPERSVTTPRRVPPVLDLPPVAPAQASPNPQPAFCSKCGSNLASGPEYCSRDGTKHRA